MSEDEGYPLGEEEEWGEEPLREAPFEIRVKTLMGTVFYVKVFSGDTVADVKRKICKIEGIPIYQQNLIFQSSELQDGTHLNEAGIRQGSVLQLVAAMRGGPISAKKLTVSCDHHLVLKELKEILENTKEEIVPGSKVSMLVFKEGATISLVRVVENDDGSLSPYGEKNYSPPESAAPPFKAKKECRTAEILTGILERFSENSDMMNKMANLKRRMEETTLKKQGNSSKMSSDSTERPEKNPSVSYKLLSQCSNDSKLRSYEEENEEELALKDKHRSKLFRSPDRSTKSKYSECKGAYSHTKHSYARIHKKAQESLSSTRTEEKTTTGECYSRIHKKAQESMERTKGDESATTSRIHLTRLVLSEPEKDDLWGGQSPKTTPADYYTGLYRTVPRLVTSQREPTTTTTTTCDYYFARKGAPLYSTQCSTKFSLVPESSSDVYLGYSEPSGEFKKHSTPPPSSTATNNTQQLPPVFKNKKSRCSECNKRLNITNMYDCRCGKLFCSQHRYSEVHNCTYDYKSEGRKLLERQCPLVTAEKVAKI